MLWHGTRLFWCLFLHWKFKLWLMNQKASISFIVVVIISLIYMHWIGWSEQWTLWRLHRVLILTWRQMCDHQCGSNPYSISKLFQHSTKNFLSFQFKVDWFGQNAITFLFLKRNCSLPSISSFALLVVNLPLFNKCFTTAKSSLTGHTYYYCEHP